MLAQEQRKVHMIRIHCWGGLGSQLHTLALLIYLREHFKSFEYVVVFHSSGVTRRIPDPIFEELKIKSEFVDDFLQKPATTASSLISKILSLGKKVVQKLLHNFGLSIRPNSLRDISIKPWTREFRGHYSNISFPLSIYQALQNLLQLCPTIEAVKDKLAIHARAGDLLTLRDKTVTPISNLLRLCRLDPFKNSETIFFTESEDWLIKAIYPYQLESKVSLFGPEINPTMMMQNCISARQFIGTNSKLSLWICLFRLMDGQDITAIPSSLKMNFESFRPVELVIEPIYY